MRNALVDRLGGEAANPAYRLEVELDDDLTAFGIRGDSCGDARAPHACARAIGWSRLTTGQVVLDATAGSDAGIDVVSSEYATVAAEQTAQERLAQVIADQMVSRARPVRAQRRRAMKAVKASLGQRARPARPGDSLLPVPRPRRGGIAGAGRRNC